MRMTGVWLYQPSPETDPTEYDEPPMVTSSPGEAPRADAAPVESDTEPSVSVPASPLSAGIPNSATAVRVLPVSARDWAMPIGSTESTPAVRDHAADWSAVTAESAKLAPESPDC